MRTLAHEVVCAPGASPSRTAFFLHGILGAGRNWRSFTRRLAERHTDWRFVLPDLRNHGDSPALPPPHTVAACAEDLAALARSVGEPAVVVGHSFGGKVALAWGEAVSKRAGPSVLRHLAVLDAPPGPAAHEPGAHEVLHVIAAVRAAPSRARSREEIRDALRKRGLSETILAWLLTSTKHDDGVWRWKYDLDGVDQMIGDYFGLDFWPFLEGLPAHLSALFVRAGRSDRWTDAELARFASAPVALEVLPEAGHWVHVDDPDGLARVLDPLFGP